MGSTSDLPVMQQADVLDELGLAYEVDVVSAHRTPEKNMDYGQNAHKRGIKAIIAGAGGAAHLPGMVASVSPLPVMVFPYTVQILLTAGTAYFLFFKCRAAFLWLL